MFPLLNWLTLIQSRLFSSMRKLQMCATIFQYLLKNNL